MYNLLIDLLRSIEPQYVLLLQACIVLLFPFILWRYLDLGRWFPLGVVQIFSGVLLGPAILGGLDQFFFSPAASIPPLLDECKRAITPESKQLFNALFGPTCYVRADGTATVINRSMGIASVATIAVCLFGFLAGADADKELIRKSGKSVMQIGITGMIFGWTLASFAGWAIYYAIPQARGPNSQVFAFSIAYGLVIAVSALPVLALILRGLDITRRRLGAVALASASIADTMMWLGLGIVVALTLGGSLPVALAKAAAGCILSVGFIKWVASPILNRMLDTKAPEAAIITFTVFAIFVASTITGITKLHPVLGAFVAGFFLPDRIREMAAHRLDMCTTLVLMPFFFLNTGLRTEFSFSDPNVWILFGISTFLCVFGKMIGHGLAARMSGESWPFSMAVGMLLQTKGLMGIIVIVVFFEKGVISPLMYAAAVFMCMFSTGLPTPFMRWMFSKYGESLKDGGKVAEPIMEANGPVVSQDKPAAASKPVLATLEFEGGLGKFAVTEPRAVVGRHSDANIRVNDIRVSRHHALLALGEGNKFEIYNQMSDRAEPNPILVNGVIKERAILEDGDKVSLGGVGFVFRYAKAKVAA